MEFAFMAAKLPFRAAAISASRSVMRSHCIPVLPSEPISSLSARMTMEVWRLSSVANSAVSDG